ncbi:MAG: endonuclease NucS domain-containing protein [Verrucomicrobiota bacterium]|jgi:hypothetical protein
MEPIEFRRTISDSEANFNYLNLKDDADNRYGNYFDHIQHRAQFVIIDGSGRKTFARKHHSTQIWGALNNWFNSNDVQAGTRILVKFDPKEIQDNCPVLHLIPESTTKAVTVESIQISQPELNNEIPISLEKQLEDFLESNLELIEPGLRLYVDEDKHKGRQYPTDIGIIDLLCCRLDGSFLVIELKRGKAAREAIGQISGYVGWVIYEIAKGKPVHGLILSHKEDLSLEYAVSANPNLSLRYFRLKFYLLPPKGILAAKS